MRTGNASTAVHLRVLMVEILPALALAGMPNPEASEKNLVALAGMPNPQASEKNLG